MTWQARLPATITKCGNLMIEARAVPARASSRSRRVGQSRQLSPPSTDYAKAVALGAAVVRVQQHLTQA
jgi:hypothetical protein